MTDLRPRILQLGTCRLRMPTDEEFVFDKFFSTASSSDELLQTVKLLKGIVPFPEPEISHCIFQFSGNYHIPLQQQFDDTANKIKDGYYHGFIIEITSIKRVVHDGWYLHLTMLPSIRGGKWDGVDIPLPPPPEPNFEIIGNLNLDDVIDLDDDTEDSVRDKALEIARLLDKPVLFMVQENFKEIHQRALIRTALEQANVSFLDPTRIIKEYGWNTTMVDPYHFTEFMYSVLRDATLDRLRSMFTRYPGIP